jgi:hypothetical protein
MPTRTVPTSIIGTSIEVRHRRCLVHRGWNDRSKEGRTAAGLAVNTLQFLVFHALVRVVGRVQSKAFRRAPKPHQGCKPQIQKL